MKKKILYFIILLFVNIIMIYPRYEHGGYHRYYPYYPHFHYYPLYPDYPYYFYPDYFIIESDTVFVHRMGTINLDKDLTADIKDIDEIVFRYGINGNFDRVQDKKVYFSDSGLEKVNKSILDFLNKSNIPDEYPDINNLKSYSFENDNLRFSFSNKNYYHRSFTYYTEDYYIYTLNYSLTMPYNESIKTQFDNMLTKDFKSEIDKYIDGQKKMKAAGISIFVTGFGLMGALNIASLITLAYSLNNGGVPLAVPGSSILKRNGFSNYFIIRRYSAVGSLIA